ncbi:FadR/GntR family transcriptional regulator [Herbiconiux liangxiaofengii]|uniref:FadR/GntR family transcriptional regulator n=1 Tax=Herbiconiux liangxiaofengii TaxID=3342795 RepID=UPI0035B8D81D
MSVESADTAFAPVLPTVGVRAPAARLGVAVVSQLVDVIVTGALKPGDLLPPEGPLTAQFGVSRTVIRESVKRLEEKGLVTVAQGRGTQVNPTSDWNLLDPVVLSAMIDHDDSLGILDELSSVRSGLESSMAADAARLADAAAVQRLRESLQRMQDVIDDAAAFRQADIDFHAVVMQLSGSRLASSLARTLFDRALESTRYHGRDPEHAFELTLEEHTAVLEAILEGAPEAAERAMRAHIDGSWSRRRLPVRGRD